MKHGPQRNVFAQPGVRAGEIQDQAPGSEAEVAAPVLDAPACGKLTGGTVSGMTPTSEEIVAQLTGVLVQAAKPKRIILFGSRARGDAAADSDFDVMVVEEKPANRFAEMVRLNRLLRSLDIAVDLLVVSEEKFQYWRDTPGNVYYEAASEGKILYEAA